MYARGVIVVAVVGPVQVTTSVAYDCPNTLTASWWAHLDGAQNVNVLQIEFHIGDSVKQKNTFQP